MSIEVRDLNFMLSILFEGFFLESFIPWKFTPLRLTSVATVWYRVPLPEAFSVRDSPFLAIS